MRKFIKYWTTVFAVKFHEASADGRNCVHGRKYCPSPPYRGSPPRRWRSPLSRVANCMFLPRDLAEELYRGEMTPSVSYSEDGEDKKHDTMDGTYFTFLCREFIYFFLLLLLASSMISFLDGDSEAASF